MILLEQLLREQRDKAERRKLREAEEVLCCTILRVGGAKVVEVTFNQRRLHLVVTDACDCTLVIFDSNNRNEIDGDDRREILLGLSKEVEESPSPAGAAAAPVSMDAPQSRGASVERGPFPARASGVVRAGSRQNGSGAVMLFRVRCTALGTLCEVFLVRAESAEEAREKVRARTTYYAEEAEPVEFDEDGVLRVYDGD